jgi:hypothetical protein
MPLTPGEIDILAAECLNEADHDKWSIITQKASGAEKMLITSRIIELAQSNDEDEGAADLEWWIEKTFKLVIERLRQRLGLSYAAADDLIHDARRDIEHLLGDEA